MSIPNRTRGEDSYTSLTSPSLTGPTLLRESKVLVLYTGGTIGMMRGSAKDCSSSQVLFPIRNAFCEALVKNPILHDAEYQKNPHICTCEENTFVLPNVGEKSRVVYTIREYDPLLDSSNMTSDNWTTIANDIRDAYAYYDGFVVLHGTDTLSYTASALSFMFEHLGKTIIITGSQIPIFETRSDGRENFIGALILAGNYSIPEVTVYFGNKLFRGNRTMKISTENFNAFDSPNFPPLATVGIDILVDFKSIFRPTDIEKFAVHENLSRNVGLLRLFPSITTETVNAFLQPPTEGVVMQTYGAGNAPSNRKDILDVIKAATDRGVIIVNCTQCITGGVSELYETGKALFDVGVISGYDMTPEAALTKLSYVLSKEWSIEMKQKAMQDNLRGELSITGKWKSPALFDLVDAVARSLHMTDPKEQQELGSILFPAMTMAAICEGNLQKIKAFKEYGADFCLSNSDGRTPLHMACLEGNAEIVEYLLLNGASVHLKDRYDRTPLIDAISHDHKEVIKLLRRDGAHLSQNPKVIGDQLCSAAARGNINRLCSYHLAGADLSQSDINENTPLHLAALHNHMECVSYLLSMKVCKDAKDLQGRTPLDLAIAMNHKDVVNLLNSKKEL